MAGPEALQKLAHSPQGESYLTSEKDAIGSVRICRAPIQMNSQRISRKPRKNRTEVCASLAPLLFKSLQLLGIPFSGTFS